VARASEVKPDILVADLGLPDEKGYTITAYARATDRERALAAGFQEHAVEPIDPDMLVKLIFSLL
jgi:CheY-like chemotaxis protein